MPRRARIRIAGIPVHIIQRGNNRSACFYSDEDYLYYLHTLKQLLSKYECELHAYVLMTNHVHLLLTPMTVDSASLLMKHLGQRYVQYINRTYKRTGTLWEGRFRSCLAQDELYVLNCYRYIELNPVRAMMVEKPWDYRWSSCMANGFGKVSQIITPHRQYLNMGNSPEQKMHNYRLLLAQALDEKTIDAIRLATNSNHALGDARFTTEVETMLKRRATPGKPGRPKGRYSDG